MSEPTTDRTQAPSSELATAAESITAYTKETRFSWRGRLTAHFRRTKDLYSVATAVVTSLVALVSILVTLQQFKEQMNTQRRAQTEALVSQFFTQVAELSALTAVETANSDQADVMALPKHVRQLIISRAQMLIDAEETGVHTDDILRFLTANGFGGYIGRSPTGDEPGIDANYSAFEGTKLDRSKFDGARFICLDFKDAVFDGVHFVNSWMSYARFRDSVFYEVKFTGSHFENVDFDGTKFEGRVDFKGTTFRNSNLASVELGSSFLGKENSSLTKEERRAQTFAVYLADTKSLEGTILDDMVEVALKNALDEEKYRKLRYGHDEAASTKVTTEPLLSEQWAQQCDPLLRSRSE